MSRELLQDLSDEYAALDRLLTDLRVEDWDRPTPSAGWAVRHQVAHLSFFDDVGTDCVLGDAELLAGLAGRRGGLDEAAFSSALIEPLAALPPAELLERWRLSRGRLHDALSSVPPEHRVPWGAGPMAARSFVTARLMETWAHGLDCFAAVGRQPQDTDRLRHVCHLGHRALPYAFRRARVRPVSPLSELRIEVAGPSGDLWSYGDPAAPQVITGSAGEWARVAVQRLPASAASTLRADGELARQTLEVARAFA